MVTATQWREAEGARLQWCLQTQWSQEGKSEKQLWKEQSQITTEITERCLRTGSAAERKTEDPDRTFWVTTQRLAVQ